MAERLFPVFDMPEIVPREEKYEEKYKPSVAWDMAAGDFIRDGAHKLISCDGKEAYETWCYKVVSTERFACSAYPDEIGTEMEQAMKEKSNEAVESAVERSITEALLVNPRTEYVRGFAFDWKGDSLYCSFTVKGIEWEEFPLSVAINK